MRHEDHTRRAYPPQCLWETLSHPIQQQTTYPPYKLNDLILDKIAKEESQHSIPVDSKIEITHNNKIGLKGFPIHP